jgi:hypothetical protein
MAKYHKSKKAKKNKINKNRTKKNRTKRNRKTTSPAQQSRESHISNNNIWMIDSSTGSEQSMGSIGVFPQPYVEDFDNSVEYFIRDIIRVLTPVQELSINEIREIMNYRNRFQPHEVRLETSIPFSRLFYAVGGSGMIRAHYLENGRLIPAINDLLTHMTNMCITPDLFDDEDYTNARIREVIEIRSLLPHEGFQTNDIRNYGVATFLSLENCIETMNKHYKEYGSYILK